jgi:hypothetical protein
METAIPMNKPHLEFHGLNMNTGPYRKLDPAILVMETTETRSR